MSLQFLVLVRPAIPPRLRLRLRRHLQRVLVFPSARLAAAGRDAGCERTAPVGVLRRHLRSYPLSLDAALETHNVIAAITTACSATTCISMRTQGVMCRLHEQREMQPGSKDTVVGVGREGCSAAVEVGGPVCAFTCGVCNLDLTIQSCRRRGTCRTKQASASASA